MVRGTQIAMVRGAQIRPFLLKNKEEPAMAMDPRKRQKKLERKKAKVRAKRQKLARQETQEYARRMQEMATAPILHCRASTAILQQGMGQVLISRKLSSGMVAVGCFLVDSYCLGVKDAFMLIGTRAQYNEKFLEGWIRQEKTIKMRPACARKLIEGAVQYAEDLGFSPHADYRDAKRIFGELDVEDCRKEFTFGKDGKPFFVAGPYDSPARCERIIRTLDQHCGPGHYHYLMPAGEHLLEGMEELEELDTASHLS